MGLLLPFFVIGMMRGIATGDRSVLVMTAFLVVHTLLHVVVHSVTRYRLPVEPFYALIGFQALTAMVTRKQPGPPLATRGT